MSPLVIVTINEPSILAAIESAASAIERLCPVVILKAVLNLAFVTLRELVRNLSKEDPAVQMLAVRFDFPLKNEVAEPAGAFEHPWSVFDLQLTGRW